MVSRPRFVHCDFCIYWSLFHPGTINLQRAGCATTIHQEWVNLFIKIFLSAPLPPVPANVEMEKRITPVFFLSFLPFSRRFWNSLLPLPIPAFSPQRPCRGPTAKLTLTRSRTIKNPVSPSFPSNSCPTVPTSCWGNELESNFDVEELETPHTFFHCTD